MQIVCVLASERVKMFLSYTCKGIIDRDEIYREEE